MAKKTEVKKHLKLETPPLVEALFVMQFDPTMDYSLFTGAINAGLKELFPEVETLPPAALTGMPTAFRHRFASVDGTVMFQTGPGILSVNQLHYGQFKKFFELIDIILFEFIKAESKPFIRMMGLQYINRISLENKTMEDIVAIKVSLPKFLESGLDARSYNFLVTENINGKLQVTISNTIRNNKPVSDEIALDFEHFIEVNDILNINKINTWIKTAHDNIIEAFIGCLNPDYLKSIQKSK
ncbi:MAG: TIGR04255 family protein [Candidatus Margulisiibacteriota bacterium]